MLLFARVEPFLEAIRGVGAPLAFRNAEWVARECPEGKPIFERFAARVRKTLESR